MGLQFDKAGNLAVEKQPDKAFEALLEARRLYVGTFQKPALEITFDTHMVVAKAFLDAQEAVRTGSASKIPLYRSQVDAASVKIAYLSLVDALEKGNVGRATTWFTVMTELFDFKREPSQASLLMAELERAPGEMAQLQPLILANLLALSTARLEQKAQEALRGLEQGAPAAAVQAALEGLKFYGVLQTSFVTTLGKEQGGKVTKALSDLEQHAAQGDVSGAREDVQEIQAALRAYRGAVQGRVASP